MPDLWGPGAFGAADPSVTRPTYDPANGPADPDTWYKDCSSPAEDDGTQWVAAALNMMLAQMRQVVRRSSVSPTNLDDDLLLKAIVSGAVSYAVATGSANAWVISPSLAVPAYAAGRELNVIAPATNTSTTVNADISDLGNRRIKKSDGSDPAVGDLVAGRVYATIDDGANIRILTTLPSDMQAQIRAQKVTRIALSGNVSAASGVTTQLSGLTTGASTLSTSSWSGGALTIGPGEDGIWVIAMSGTLATSNAVSEGFIRKNGYFGVGTQINGYGGYGPSGFNAKGSACFPAQVAVGDTINFEIRHNASGTFNTFVTVDLYRIGAA